MREHIAVKEAKKLNIPIFAMVDTNSDPRPIDFLIPSNDDASKSINIIMQHVTDAIAEGLSERKSEKQADKEGEEPKTAKAEVAKTEAPVEEAVSEVAAEAPKEVKKEKAAPVVAEKKTEAEEKPKKETAKKAKTTADDLTKVEGIGPKISEVLQNAGIMTFADLASKSEEDLKEILAGAGARYASKNPASWPKQAKMAADGKWDELKEWQDNTKAGVE
jgi:small subunit ribosomal protein S2